MTSTSLYQMYAKCIDFLATSIYDFHVSYNEAGIMAIPHFEQSPSLGTRLRQTRESRGLSQRAAADLIGVTQVTWSRWETGQSRVQRRYWPEIAAFLELELREIRGLQLDAVGRPVVVPLRGAVEAPQGRATGLLFTLEQREALAAVRRSMGNGRKLEAHEVEWFKHLLSVVGLGGNA